MASLATMAVRQPSRSPATGREAAGMAAPADKAARASGLMVGGAGMSLAGTRTGVSLMPASDRLGEGWASPSSHAAPNWALRYAADGRDRAGRNFGLRTRAALTTATSTATGASSAEVLSMRISGLPYSWRKLSISATVLA